MENRNVILSVKVYENLLNYLGNTQVYNNVAQLISDTVRDANENAKVFTVTSIPQDMSQPNSDIIEAEVID